MFKIFLKDLKERFLLILFFLILPLFVPLISKLFFSQFREDANLIIYAIFYYVALPLYILISSSNLLIDENLKFIKSLPLSLNKIIFSKLLFLILNSLIFTFIYFLFFQKSYFLISNEKFSFIMVFNIYFVFFLNFLSFSLCNLTKKKINSIFFATLINYLNFYNLFYLISNFRGFSLTFYGIYIVFLIVLFLLLFLVFYSSKMILIEKKFSNLSIIFLILIFLLPTFYIFKIKDKVFKNFIISNHYADKLDENNLLIDDPWEKEHYIFNLKKKKLKLLPQLTGLYLRSYGNKFYYGINFKNADICGRKENAAIYYSYDFNSNRTEKLGIYPSYSHTYGNIVFWWHNIAAYDYEINISDKNFNNCFRDICKRFVLLKNGIFYKKSDDNTYKFFYVNFEKKEKKEVLIGNYQMEEFGFWEFENIDYVYLLKDKKLYKFEIEEFKIKEIGKYYLLCDFKDGYTLLGEKKDEDNVIIHLLKNEELLTSKKFNYAKIDGFYLYKRNYYNKYLFIYLFKNKKYLNGIISIENDDINLYLLPKGTENVEFLSEKGDVILYKDVKIPIFNRFYLKAFLYNFKTGEMENI